VPVKLLLKVGPRIDRPTESTHRRFELPIAMWANSDPGVELSHLMTRSLRSFAGVFLSLIRLRVLNGHHYHNQCSLALYRITLARSTLFLWRFGLSLQHYCHIRSLKP